MIYRAKWQKRWIRSIIGYLRDCVIQLIPFRLPLWARIKLYGFEPQFVFIVHARRKEDIFIALPFLRVLRDFLPRKYRYKVLQAVPPFVLGKVKTPKGVNGLIITTTKLPETLLNDRRESLKEARRCLSLAFKLAKSSAYIGLGGWWPMVTRRGQSIKKYAEDHALVLTNGHTGTLCSIYLMINKIAAISNLNLKDLSIVVLGVGKMGQNVVGALSGKVGSIVLYDRNVNKSLRILNEIAGERNSETYFSAVPFDKDLLLKALSKCHIAVCTTSNMQRILKNDELPNNLIVIDDSRPEAFSRLLDTGKKKVILEGGLLKIMDAKTNYHFGFGINSNVFGCLAEAYILAVDGGRQLRPTLGEVDFNNFNKMLSVLNENHVYVGDFKTSNIKISDELIRSVYHFSAIDPTEALTAC